MKICETKAWKIQKKSLKFWVSLFFLSRSASRTTHVLQIRLWRRGKVSSHNILMLKLIQKTLEIKNIHIYANNTKIFFLWIKSEQGLHAPGGRIHETARLL